MKIPRLALLIALLLGSAVPGWAQTLSTTGTITAFSRETGQFTVIPGGGGRPAHLRDMKRGRYLYGSGRRATFDQVQDGLVVTVHYVRHGERWYVGHVVLPDPVNRPYPAMPPGGLAVGERRATTSHAASDGDITTQPGTKARIDRDITTQPGTTDPRTNTDITKRPDNR